MSTVRLEAAVSTRVLVTGASGYIGSRLVPHLLEAQCQVVTLLRGAQAPRTDGSADQPRRTGEGSAQPRHTGESRYPETSESWIPASAGMTESPVGMTASSETPAVVYGDLCDSTTCARACRGVDVVIHLAGIAHVGASAAALRAINLDATLQLARAARQAGARRFVFISSSKARYPQHSAYGRLKAEAEAQLLAMHEPDIFTVVCLRPALVYGPGMRGNLAGLLRLLRRPYLPVFIRSEQLIGMIGLADLCRCLVLATRDPRLAGQVWPLSDGAGYTLDAIVAAVRTRLGLRPPALYLPRLVAQCVAGLATVLSPLYRSSFSMSTYRTLFEESYPADSQFRAITGFAPAENFYQALPELLEEEARA